MPLSTPVSRELAHTRVVTCKGFKRSDNLWDIEGRIVDTKPYSFPNRDRGGMIQADEALHDMSIRLTIDINLEVIDADAIIDSSPYNYCQSISPVVKQLIGLRIAPGWTNKSRIAMGSSAGCTHLTELLGPIATTAIQTIASEKSIQAVKQNNAKRPSYFLNTCHSLAAHSPVVKEHWPELYQPGNSADQNEVPGKQA